MSSPPIADRGDPPAILSARGISKVFAPRPFGTFVKIVRSRWSGTRPELATALDSVTFDLGEGETLGLIGRNGAGKSSLLRVLAGIYRPSAGQVVRKGRILLVAGLGAGMRGELSVRDNVRLYGAICGIAPDTLRRRFDEIVDWAELDADPDAELRTLSQGNKVRLAFSIALRTNRSILLLDEAFSAGDLGFAKKGRVLLQETKASRQGTIVAAHALEFVEEFCDRALWLDRGRVRAIGPAREVVARYRVSVSG